jgi:hypothetical protein
MNTIDFREGFKKDGFSGDVLPRIEMTPNKVQSFELRKHLSTIYGKYAKKEKINQWCDEMENIEQFFHMNVKFVAAALLIIYRNLTDIEYPTEPEQLAEVSPILKDVVFSNPNIMEEYLSNMIDQNRRNEKSSVDFLSKKVLFTYIYKILTTRLYSSGKSIERDFEEYEPAPSEVSYPVFYNT